MIMNIVITDKLRIISNTCMNIEMIQSMITCEFYNHTICDIKLWQPHQLRLIFKAASQHGEHIEYYFILF